MFLHPPAVAWGTPLSMLSWNELIALGAFLFIVTVLSGRIKHWRVEHDSQLEQVRRLNEATQQLIKANMGFQRYADGIEEKSAEEERKRITREIHDTVAYTLVNIMMMLREASLIAADNNKLQELHEQLIDQAQTGLNETRRALRILRAAERVKISARQQIHRLVTAFSKATGVLVNVEYGNIEDSLGEEVFRCIFHMIQEGMANAFRHGRARMIQIDLWQHDSQLLFNLRDNGNGCSNSTIEEGIGLSGMRERVRSLGGQFAVSNSYVGFQISVRLPLQCEDRKQNE
jgi:signal transduction histidine kinase